MWQAMLRERGSQQVKGMFPVRRQFAETDAEIFCDGFLHDLFCLGKAACQGEFIELFSLYLQYGLDFQDRADRRGGRGHPSALFEIFHRVHGDVDGGIEFRGFEILFDLRGAFAPVAQFHGVKDAEFLGDGYPLIVDDVYFAAEVLGEGDRRLAGLAEPRRHGDVDDLVEIFQNSVPEVEHVAHAGLGGGDVGFGIFQMFVKFFLREIDIFEVGFSVDDEGHGKDENAQFFALFLRDPAVAVRDDGCFQNKLLSAAQKRGKIYFFPDFCKYPEYKILINIIAECGGKVNRISVGVTNIIKKYYKSAFSPDVRPGRQNAAPFGSAFSLTIFPGYDIMAASDEGKAGKCRKTCGKTRKSKRYNPVRRENRI